VMSASRVVSRVGVIGVVTRRDVFLIAEG
jgi:hypothetical protein